MKRSISNNKKSPVNANNNEDEVNIDVNLLLNDPKSLHKMLNKKSDDNDYVPTGANPNKLSNRPKNPYKGRPYYYDEGLWEGKKPEEGQHFKLGNIKKRTEEKQERKAKEQLEKLKAMRPVKKKEEIDDIPEFAPYAKKKYGKEDVVETDVRPPLAFFKEEGSKMIKKYISKDKRKKNNDDVTKKPKDKENNLIENFLNRKEFDNVRKELEKRKNKPKGKAVNDLNENPKFKKGAEVLRTLGF